MSTEGQRILVNGGALFGLGTHSIVEGAAESDGFVLRCGEIMGLGIALLTQQGLLVPVNAALVHVSELLFRNTSFAFFMVERVI